MRVRVQDLCSWTFSGFLWLSLQFLVGDYEEGASISDLVKVHPAQRHSGENFNPVAFSQRAVLAIKNIPAKRNQSRELQQAKADIISEWKRLKGLSKTRARHAYMEIIRRWEGFGANLFHVEQTDNETWPKEITLAINRNGVAFFPLGEQRRLVFYPYESVDRLLKLRC
eukprot:m.618728 g.618728  ORF g.618728 m.618728 type:complete len:169 (-) comp58190_c1_seq25:205-711(-)